MMLVITLLVEDMHCKVTMKAIIDVKRFPDTRKDKGYYAYVHYNNWTKMVTVEGNTKEEAYNKAISYCNKHGIKL